MDTRADEFVTQAREHLTVLESLLLALEKRTGSSDSREQVDACLRLVHSLKGDAGFLGFTAVRTLANAMETALESLREGQTSYSVPTIEVLLTARDRLASLVDDLQHSNEADLREIVTRLRAVSSPSDHALDVDLRELDRQRSGRLGEFFAMLEGLGQVSKQSIDMEPTDLAHDLPRGRIQFRARLASSLAPAGIGRTLGLPGGRGTSRISEEKALPLAIDLAQWMRASSQPLSFLLAALDRLGALEEPRIDCGRYDLSTSLPTGPFIWHGGVRTSSSHDEIERRLGLSTSPTVYIEQPLAPAHVPSPVSSPSPAVRVITHEPEKPTSLRIGVELLDRLMTLTGELTLIRNQSVLAVDPEEGRLRPIVQRLDAVTTALQETVLRTRMQPVGNLFGKFPRVVRDLGRQLGKQVEITIVGKEVELDKTILEQLSDPVTHLVRNCVDHGLERPDERVAKGKPPTGQIILSATHDEGQVRIEVRDDGRGIDPQAVRNKALAMRLKTEAELDRMTPRELMSLILLPGFSTAREVTEVSGRGVGMDVVKTNIELLEGSLVIDSVPGLGTAMVVRLPLTLAIIPCLIVAVDQERFAIPQRDLQEAVCLHPELGGLIEQAFDTEVYRLRDRLLPVVRLSEVLDRPEPFTPAARAEMIATHAAAGVDRKRIEYLLVLRSAGRRFGLVVDDVRGTEEIVVKPLHPSLKRIGIFTGATIMGDGRVALIADVEGIADHARLRFDRVEESATEVADPKKIAQPHRVLLFDYGPHEQFGLPLLQIRRIEMVDLARVERIGHHEYVTLDGVSMRIMRLDRLIGVSAPDEAALERASQWSLIVPRFGQEPTAILVSRIVDTELLSVDLQEHSEHDEGILGSAIVRGRLTLFLDIHRLTQNLYGTPRQPSRAGVAPSPERPRRLLLIDDTPFFREVVKRYLVAQGHEVATAINGKDALEQIAANRDFDLIVSDIEMPVMDGWELAREVRRRGIKTPMLALTSLSGVSYENKAKECGYDDFEVKLDHDRLVRKVSGLLAARGRVN